MTLAEIRRQHQLTTAAVQPQPSTTQQPPIDIPSDNDSVSLGSQDTDTADPQDESANPILTEPESVENNVPDTTGNNESENNILNENIPENYHSHILIIDESPNNTLAILNVTGDASTLQTSAEPDNTLITTGNY